MWISMSLENWMALGLGLLLICLIASILSFISGSFLYIIDRIGLPKNTKVVSITGQEKTFITYFKETYSVMFMISVISLIIFGIILV